MFNALTFDPNAIFFSPKLIHVPYTFGRCPNNDSTHKATISGCEAVLMNETGERNIWYEFCKFCMIDDLCAVYI